MKKFIVILVLIALLTGCADTISPLQAVNEKSYQTSLSDSIGKIDSGIDALADSTQNVTNANFKERKALMAKAIVQITGNAQAIKKTLPPDSVYNPGQTLLNSGAEMLIAGTQDFLAGVDTLDIAILSRSADEIKQGMYG